MPTQQFASLANILNMAKPDWVLFTVASWSCPPPRAESTWDMANRICDRYFSDAPSRPSPMVSKAA